MEVSVYYWDYLLGKLDNLSTYKGLSEVFGISFNPDISVGTKYQIPFDVSKYNSIAILAIETYGDNNNGIYQEHWNLSGGRSYNYHLKNCYSVQLVIDRTQNILEVRKNNTSTSREQYIKSFSIWGVN